MSPSFLGMFIYPLCYLECSSIFYGMYYLLIPAGILGARYIECIASLYPQVSLGVSYPIYIWICYLYLDFRAVMLHYPPLSLDVVSTSTSFYLIVLCMAMATKYACS